LTRQPDWTAEQGAAPNRRLSQFRLSSPGRTYFAYSARRRLEDETLRAELAGRHSLLRYYAVAAV